MAWSPRGSCPWSGSPFTSLLSPLTEPRHSQCMAVVKGSLLTTQLERVKEFWEKRISKKILCIVRRKEGGRDGAKEDFFEAVCKSAVIWCLRLISYENCCLQKEGSKLCVGVSGYPSHWSTQHSPGQITTL